LKNKHLNHCDCPSNCESKNGLASKTKTQKTPKNLKVSITEDQEKSKITTSTRGSDQSAIKRKYKRRAKIQRATAVSKGEQLVCTLLQKIICFYYTAFLCANI